MQLRNRKRKREESAPPVLALDGCTLPPEMWDRVVGHLSKLPRIAVDGIEALVHTHGSMLELMERYVAMVKGVTGPELWDVVRRQRKLTNAIKNSADDWERAGGGPNLVTLPFIENRFPDVTSCLATSECFPNDVNNDDLGFTGMTGTICCKRHPWSLRFFDNGRIWIYIALRTMGINVHYEHLMSTLSTINSYLPYGLRIHVLKTALVAYVFQLSVPIGHLLPTVNMDPLKKQRGRYYLVTKVCKLNVPTTLDYNSVEFLLDIPKFIRVPPWRPCSGGPEEWDESE